MNSAILSEGSMRTSWPRLRNSYYANLALRSIPAETTAGQQPCAAHQRRCRPVFRPEAENATQDSLRRKLRNSVSDWVGVSLWLQGEDVDVGVSSSLAVGVRCGGSDDGWNDRPSGEAL